MLRLCSRLHGPVPVLPLGCKVVCAWTDTLIGCTWLAVDGPFLWAFDLGDLAGTGIATLSMGAGARRFGSQGFPSLSDHHEEGVFEATLPGGLWLHLCGP